MALQSINEWSWRKKITYAINFVKGKYAAVINLQMMNINSGGADQIDVEHLLSQNMRD